MVFKTSVIFSLGIIPFLSESSQTKKFYRFIVYKKQLYGSFLKVKSDFYRIFILNFIKIIILNCCIVIFYFIK